MRSLSPLASLANVFRIPMSMAPARPSPSSATSFTTLSPLAPLRFSRNRYLRHWTIHRAWQLLQAKQRRNQELELQRQYQSMHAACEELRTGAGDGGKLFRVAMNKKGVFSEMFPIEYGRMQTDYPPPRVGTMSGNALRRSTRCLFEDRYTMR
ncbi:hypothetical protein N7468_004384 [Penicillium chermesinum]|uniref:Large ribosomal subunit protein mL40 n=1 Tax=Penicillium chermesinum TaxID=63820 RepID=A0A9W9P8E8_9EURO|nr:uncharacterized protein N7468_004384 [Penicillium chermesinum]KAJ5239765.1 hypothetical protein N7468_004384 [Penicillium chermesinum]